MSFGIFVDEASSSLGSSRWCPWKLGCGGHFKDSWCAVIQRCSNTFKFSARYHKLSLKTAQNFLVPAIVKELMKGAWQLVFHTNKKWRCDESVFVCGYFFNRCYGCSSMHSAPKEKSAQLLYMSLGFNFSSLGLIPKLRSKMHLTSLRIQLEVPICFSMYESEYASSEPV